MSNNDQDTPEAAYRRILETPHLVLANADLANLVKLSSATRRTFTGSKDPRLRAGMGPARLPAAEVMAPPAAALPRPELPTLPSSHHLNCPEIPIAHREEMAVPLPLPAQTPDAAPSGASLVTLIKEAVDSLRAQHGTALGSFTPLYSGSSRAIKTIGVVVCSSDGRSILHSGLTTLMSSVGGPNLLTSRQEGGFHMATAVLSGRAAAEYGAFCVPQACSVLILVPISLVSGVSAALFAALPGFQRCIDVAFTGKSLQAQLGKGKLMRVFSEQEAQALYIKPPSRPKKKRTGEPAELTSSSRLPAPMEAQAEAQPSLAPNTTPFIPDPVIAPHEELNGSKRVNVDLEEAYIERARQRKRQALETHDIEVAASIGALDAQEGEQLAAAVMAFMASPVVVAAAAAPVPQVPGVYYEASSKKQVICLSANDRKYKLGHLRCQQSATRVHDIAMLHLTGDASRLAYPAIDYTELMPLLGAMGKNDAIDVLKECVLKIKAAEWEAERETKPHAGRPPKYSKMYLENAASKNRR